MLIELDPGLICKKCKGGVTYTRMLIAKDIPGSVNMLLKQDKEVKSGDFECIITCISCMTQHRGSGFIRNGIFRGIHKYGIDSSA